MSDQTVIPAAVPTRFLDRFGVKEVLAILSMLALIAFGAAFLLKPPGNDNQILLTIVTQLTAIVLLVYNNYFGSTAQSKQKDDTIAALVASPTATPTPPVPPVVPVPPGSLRAP